MADKHVLKWQLQIPVEVEYEMLYGHPNITAIKLLWNESADATPRTVGIAGLDMEQLRSECIRAVVEHVKAKGE